MKAFVESSERNFAYLMLRATLGVNFAGHGLIRIYHGTGIFAHQMVLQLAKAPLSPALVSGFGYFVPWFQVLLGIVLVVGLFTRAVLISGSLFVIALTVGISANQQWYIAAQRLLYSVPSSFCFFSLNTTDTPPTRHGTARKPPGYFAEWKEYSRRGSNGRLHLLQTCCQDGVLFGGSTGKPALI